MVYHLFLLCGFLGMELSAGVAIEPLMHISVVSDVITFFIFDGIVLFIFHYLFFFFNEKITYFCRNIVIFCMFILHLSSHCHFLIGFFLLLL